VVSPGSARRQIAGTLKAAYGLRLLSEDTLCDRLDQLLRPDHNAGLTADAAGAHLVIGDEQLTID
jgi:hypothetical protein